MSTSNVPTAELKRTANAASKNLQQFRLSIHRESWLMPFLFLLLSVAIFTIYALPSGERQVIDNAYQLVGKPVPEEFRAPKKPNLTEAFGALELIEDPLMKRFTSHPLEVIQTIGMPLLKVYLTKVVKDFRTIAESSGVIVATFALCALIPGLAGLIYRRGSVPPQCCETLLTTDLAAAGVS